VQIIRYVAGATQGSVKSASRKVVRCDAVRAVRGVGLGTSSLAGHIVTPQSDADNRFDGYPCERTRTGTVERTAAGQALLTSLM